MIMTSELIKKKKPFSSTRLRQKPEENTFCYSFARIYYKVENKPLVQQNCSKEIYDTWHDI